VTTANLPESISGTAAGFRRENRRPTGASESSVRRLRRGEERGAIETTTGEKALAIVHALPPSDRRRGQRTDDDDDDVEVVGVRGRLLPPPRARVVADSHEGEIRSTMLRPSIIDMQSR
jgi:hypothetical protein